MGTLISGPNFNNGIPANNCCVISHTQKKLNVNLMVVLEETFKINKVSRIHPLGTLSVRTKCHGNPLNNCCDTAGPER